MDVNVLIYAHRADLSQHDAVDAWMQSVINGAALFGVPSLALSGFLRIVTRKPFEPPTPLHQALDFCDRLVRSPMCRIVNPGPAHWGIFARLCAQTQAVGSIVPDAYFAAMALELGCEWITAYSGFRRFPGLAWRHPWENQATTNPR